MKKFTIYLALVLVLSLSLALPCFAYYNIENLNGQYYITFDGSISNGDLVCGEWVWVGDIPDFDPSVYSVVSYTLQGSAADTFSSRGVWTEESGAYFVSADGGDFQGTYFIAYCPVVNYENVFTRVGFYVLAVGAPSPVYYPASVTIYDPNADSGDTAEPTGIYWDIFDILHTHIYGGVELTSDMNLVLTMLSTIACLFCFAVPFMVVWWVIKRIT